MITKEQSRAIFSELEVIMGYNKMLLGGLEARMQKWNFFTNLGDIFKRMVTFLYPPLLFLTPSIDRLLEGIYTSNCSVYLSINSLKFILVRQQL